MSIRMSTISTTSAVCNLSFSIFFLLSSQLNLFLYFTLETNRNGQSRIRLQQFARTNPHTRNCRRLRTELQLIRHKGAIKINGGIGGGSLDRPNIETYVTCARCCTELGRIINRGAPCRVCRLRVCKGCREFSTRTTDWVCIVCHKQMWVLMLLMFSCPFDGSWFLYYFIVLCARVKCVACNYNTWIIHVIAWSEEWNEMETMELCGCELRRSMGKRCYTLFSYRVSSTALEPYKSKGERITSMLFRVCVASAKRKHTPLRRHPRAHRSLGRFGNRHRMRSSRQEHANKKTRI